MNLRIIYALSFFLYWHSFALASSDMSSLKKHQVLADFRVDHLYSNSEGMIVAAKFSHVPTGAPVFLLQLETVPELLTWVDSPPDSNRGLAHSLEHLLIIKGTKGRYLNLLKEMHLSRGGAETSNNAVYYGLSSGAGVDGFFEEFHALLDALYHPDFNDIEAQREFFHFAVTTGGRTNKALTEGGTVYDEMLSNQRHWTYIFELYKRVFGEHSPFAFSSVGEPDEMREVSAEEIRQFHDKYYHIGPSTGFIFSFSPRENITGLLEKISHEFQQFSEHRVARKQAPEGEPKYPIHPSENTEPGIYPFPGPNEAAPGYVHFAWAPARSTSILDLKMLELFSHALAVGEDSLLYRALVDSKMRTIDSGATGVDSDLFLDNSPHFPVLIVEVSGIAGNQISTQILEQLRAVLLKTIKDVSHFPDQSKALVQFNQSVASYVKNLRRSEVVATKNPPGFDSYPPKTDWKAHLDRLEMDSSFIRSLSGDREWQAIEKQLRSGKNVWRDLIRKFHLLQTPYVTATAPSPKLLEEIEKRKQERIKSKIRDLTNQYHTTDEQEALSRFEEEELIKTKEIDAIDARVAHPPFTDHPPLTPDDEIRYTQFQVEGVPVIASLFGQPPTIDIGLSFDLRKVPQRYYKYLPLFPKCLDSLGLKKGGQVVSYAELAGRIQKNLFAFSTSNEVNPVSHRADFTIRASAANLQEFRGALALIRDLMLFNNLDASNTGRLRDIVAGRVSSDNLYPQQDASTTNAGYAFRYQDDLLYLALNSRFTGTHLDNRLRWLLHEPVSPEEMKKLDSISKNILSSSTAMTRQQLAQHFDSLKVNGLEKELLDYLRSNLSSFPEAELTDGLRRLEVEVEEDLQAGPSTTIEDLRALQKLILDRGALRIDLTLSQPILDEVQADLVNLVRSIPARSLELAHSEDVGDPVYPLTARLEKRYRVPREHSPLYVGLVNPGRTGGDVIFSADFPDYSQIDRRSLLRVLASALFAGVGPQSFQIRTLARGLAYHNTIASYPAVKRLWYYADRSPDVPSLVNFVNEIASTVSELHDPTLVDYAFSYTFTFSRAAATFSERGQAIALDIRDGNEPEKIKRFSEAILRLRKEPDLLSELTRTGLAAICPVLLRDDCKVPQQAERAQFFFQGSEHVLSDVEKRLPMPKLLRLYPSDFWINY